MPKTKRLYYFTCTKYALEDIQKHRVKASELDNANDIFESLSYRSAYRCRASRRLYPFPQPTPDKQRGSVTYHPGQQTPLHRGPESSGTSPRRP